ncbi:MAG: hypothetical protein KGJ88_10000 [Verrucomicrobiota bacterium]|nr:hypothetical protein [Verrucomicrobiota bacterium]
MRVASRCFAQLFLQSTAAAVFLHAAAFAAEPHANFYRSVGSYITGASNVAPATNAVRSPLEFDSSDQRLNRAFRWANAQAMAYVFDDGDPVGPWYEAAEPGREAFCMRDTAHQAMGAQALGLARFNLNMLRHFAAAVSDSKDWCSYWEINRFDQPAPVDYKNDAEFWYNLPANFDVLACCFRMYVWTGDQSYLNDPVFLNFYNRTVNDYVGRWGLGIDEVMKRPRLLNVRGIFDPARKFPKNRGIPGYNEQDHSYVLGVDVLETQRAAYLAYARIQQARANADLALEFLDKAAAVEHLLTNTWWDAANHCFYARLDKNYRLEGRGPENLLWDTVRYCDHPDAGYQQLMNAAFGSNSRREYPETSFSWIGNLVNGTMGINLIFTSPLRSAQKGNWVEVIVQTRPALPENVKWAELRNLPIRANEVTVRHEGDRKTEFTNQRGPALIWQAAFAGARDTLLVNGRPMRAMEGEDSSGQPISWVKVIVGAGGSASVGEPNQKTGLLRRL